MPAGEIFVDIYADHGCSYAPSCLECPFEVCRYDKGFAGNRVTKAVSRVDRDRQVTEMRDQGMQVDVIARQIGVSSRTIARILSRKGPSKSDFGIVRQHDAEIGAIVDARDNELGASLRAMGVKPRAPWPRLTPRSGDPDGQVVYANAS